MQRIDPSTGTASAPIRVGNGPDGLALDGTSLWVAHGQGSSIERLDARDGQSLGGSVPVGAGAKGIVASSDGIWVANQAGLSVTHLTGTADRVAATVAVGDGPSAVLAVSNQVWVADAYDGTISQLDRASNRLVHRYSVGGSPHGLAIAGSDVWVTSDAFAGGQHVGGTLVVDSTAFSDDYSRIDPANVYAPAAGSAERPVYDGLVAFRAQGGTAGGVTLVPDLAADLPNPTDQGRTYTFAMRQGIRYSTGEIVHASDILRGLRRELIIGRTSGSPELFFGILGAQECSQNPASCDTELKRGVEVDDGAGLITFHLEQADASFLYKLTFFVMAVPPRPDTEAKTTPLPATGPYQISQYLPKKTLVLTRNPQFKQWSFAAQPAGYPDEIVFRRASSTTAEMNDVLAGRADLIWTHELDATQIGPLARTYPGQFRPVASFGVGYATLNTTVPPLNDRRVRQAIAEAVDRRAIAGLFGGDSAANPTCQILPRGFPGYRAYCPYADADFAPRLTDARSLVAAAGAAGATINVYAWQDPPEAPQITAYLVGVLHNLGFKTTTRTIGGGQSKFLTALREARRYPVLGSFNFWNADYSEPSTFFDQLFTCGSIQPANDFNLSLYCNPTTDKAIAYAEALETTDQAAASKAWADVDRQVTSDAPVIPIVQGVFSWFTSTRVGNFQATPLASVLYSQMWVR